MAALVSGPSRSRDHGENAARVPVATAGRVPICILHYRKVFIGCYDSVVVMPPTNDTGTDLEEKLVSIDQNLQDIRHDVAGILRSVQNELEAMREREFWRDYRETYQEE